MRSVRLFPVLCSLNRLTFATLRFQLFFSVLSLRRHYPDQVLGYDLSLCAASADNFRHPVLEICCEGSECRCNGKINFYFFYERYVVML